MHRNGTEPFVRSASRSANRAKRKGFTLAEVLVTLAIIAVMAAVLLPALNQQISKGDVGRLASDLTNIQTAIQAYVSDVHRYPNSVAQLTTSAGATDINNASIPSPLQSKWKGPYVSRDVIASTGAGGTISPTFTASAAASSTNSVSYLGIVVSGIASADFANIEAILDEGTASSTSTTAGVVRYVPSSTTMTFFAVPIQ